MKTLFPGYYTPSKEDFDKLWKECIFSFDANSLLNIYRYSLETQKSFLDILERLKERIWITHQVAFEFSKNRQGVIEDQLQFYDKIDQELDNAFEKLKTQLAVFKRHRSINIHEVFESVKVGIDTAKDSLKNDKQSHPDWAMSDPLSDKVSDLFEGKIGAAFSDTELVKIHKDAEDRYKRQIPPGYKDAGRKGVPEKYGDLVIWFQLIDYTRLHKKPLIFVTDENKEDWWLKNKGRILSPRPELVSEMQEKGGVAFYLYQPDRFIEYALAYLGLEGQEAAVEEVREVRQQDETYQNAYDYFVTRDWIGNRLLNNVGAFDSVLLKRTAEAEKVFDNPLTREAIRSATLFDSHLDNPTVRRALEDARGFNDPLIRQVERMKAMEAPQMIQAAEMARRMDEPLMRHGAEFARALENPLGQRLTDAARGLDISSMRHAMEAAQAWRNNPMAGFPIPRDIKVEVFPKRKSDQSEASGDQVKIEVLLPTEEDEAESDVEDREEVLQVETESFEFNNFPLTVTLTHRADSSHPFETTHRVRMPTCEEWNTWARSIKRTRRYFLPPEIEEYNADKDEDEKATEIWSPFYSEWEANERLYDQILLEIAGVRLDSNDEFPRDQFRVLPAEVIGKLQFETKSAVITKLYESYCNLGPLTDDQDGRRVFQELHFRSVSYNVVHSLRKPTEDESQEFRTTIVKGNFAQDEEEQEIIQMHLDLSVANAFYDSLLLDVENATCNGKEFSAETRSAFLTAINPVYKLRILEALLGVDAWYFKVDELRFPG
ncbi:MAG: PIN-like domain-containing protein [Pyrinomonadaceae bacterium]